MSTQQFHPTFHPSFVNPEVFQPHYAKSNRQGQLGYLRCFPSCAPNHRRGKTCSVPIVLRVQAELPASTEDADMPQLVALARFQCATQESHILATDDNLAGDEDDVGVGEILFKDEVEKLVRNSRVPLNPILCAKETGMMPVRPDDEHLTLPPWNHRRFLIYKRARDGGESMMIEVDFTFVECPFRHTWQGNGRIMFHFLRFYVFKSLNTSLKPVVKVETGSSSADDGQPRKLLECVVVFDSPKFSLSSTTSVPKSTMAMMSLELINLRHEKRNEIDDEAEENSDEQTSDGNDDTTTTAAAATTTTTTTTATAAATSPFERVTKKKRDR